MIRSGIDVYLDEERISNVARTFVYTGINEAEGEKSLAFYPNPYSDNVKLNVEQNATISIYNLLVNW